MCYGIQFTTPGAGGSAVPLIREAIANGEPFRANAFEYTCAQNDIDHRTTKAITSVDQRPSRAHEPHDQGGDRQALLL